MSETGEQPTSSRHTRPGEVKPVPFQQSAQVPAIAMAFRLTRGLPTWSRYALSTFFVLIAFSVQLSLTPLHLYFYLAFFPAVVLSALLFDRGNGVWASLLSAALVTQELLPRNGFTFADRQHLLAVVIFLVTGVGIAVVLELMHRFIEALIKAQEDLGTVDKAKDLLLADISHRTKNELQMLTALLHLQSRSLSDEAGRAALAAAVNRVNVLGRVHDRLTRTGTEASVDLQRFLGDLCNDLKLSLLGLQPIALKTDIASYRLPMDKAVPVGLILNELLTNAIKYAFPNGRAGTIDVRVFREDEKLCLTVADNGVGLACGAPSEGGLGQRIVLSLAQQLEGTLETREGPAGGTICRACFPISSL